MADSVDQIVVRYKGAEFPPVTELTEREKFDAERISGRSLNEIPAYTAALIMAFFTLRRGGVAVTWDEFLDEGAFSYEEVQVPLSGAAATEPDSLSGGDPTGTDGTPTIQPSSESTPG